MKVLYENQVVHRDIKLDNILVKSNSEDPNGFPDVKIADFGASKYEDALTMKDVGNFAFRAPEFEESKDVTL